MKYATRALLLLTLLAGCKMATAPTSPAKSGGSTQTQASPADAGRTIDVVVNAPNVLATGGKIVSDNLASVIAAGAGNVIAAGAGNVIAAGAGNVIAAGAHNYDVLAATDSYTPVTDAYVRLQTLDGQKPFKVVFTSGTDGAVHMTGLPMDRPYVANCFFKVGGKTYREAVTISKDNTNMAVYADPINTMVEARVRQIVATSGKELSPLTLAALKEVWGYCNEAGVTVDPANLVMNDSTQDGNLDQLNQIWTDAINNQVAKLDQASPLAGGTTRVARIKAFMAQLNAAVGNAPASAAPASMPSAAPSGS